MYFSSETVFFIFFRSECTVPKLDTTNVHTCASNQHDWPYYIDQMRVSPVDFASALVLKKITVWEISKLWEIKYS